MKLFLFTALLGLLPLALAAKALKSVIVTFPKGTPSGVIDQAKDSIVASGGVITHEYHLINGFAADAPVNALQTLSTQDTQYKPEIEEDKIVTINGDYEGEKLSL
ncbi:uncharacterized protein N7443_009244 [Penicillium atrosanguineum]|uniref:uncharacterized protein n=1 Tax=Penicillium atrosanguineum TaxID=1132637 RepID=UPI0023A24E3C|nr:uncharacterized protein N7443_009244 [Penicillium atrosanguineum]KAJ5293291.1 hypothetical protein N7443_009244 [Penicillium atrosanguineum]